MSDPSGGGQMKQQDAVMYALGELKGQMTAVVAGQQNQADVNAENKREHEEFRSHIANHDAVLAVLNDNKQTQRLNRSDAIQKWMVILGIPTALVTIAGIGLWLTSTHP